MNADVLKWLPVLRSNLVIIERKIEGLDDRSGSSGRDRSRDKDRRSLAMLSKYGGKVDLWAGEFIASFKEIDLEIFKDVISQWLESDRPDYISVQTLLMVFAKKSSKGSCPIRELFEHMIETIQDRTASGDLNDLWWAHNCVDRFTSILPEGRLLVSVNEFMQVVNSAIDATTPKKRVATASS